MIKDKALQDSFENLQFKFAELVAGERHKGNVYAHEGTPSAEEENVIKERTVEDVQRAYYEHRAQQLEEIQSKFLSIMKKFENFGNEREERRKWREGQEVMEMDEETGVYKSKT